MKKTKILLLLFGAALGTGWAGCHAQTRTGVDTMRLTLDQALAIASVQSIDAMIAKNTLESAYWTYRNYKADLLPSMTFSGTLPSLNRSLTNYQKEDGTYEFIPSSSLSGSAGLSITQNIPYTGGTILIQSQLQRIQQLDGAPLTSWLSVPAVISLEQPLITSRPLYWSMKIEPERYKAAIQQFAVDMETVSIKTIQYYFNLLLSIVNKEIAEQNLANATQLYEIAQAKKERGLISDNDLLQLKLGKLNAEAGVVTALQSYKENVYSFRNFLGFNNDMWINVDVPDEAPTYDITLDQVMELAKQNNPINHNTRRRLLEAQQIIANARANRGFQVNVYASIGFTGSDKTFTDSYRNLKNYQVASLGVRIPILDWGQGKGRVQLAKSQAEVEKNQVRQDNLDFEQSVTLAVQRYQDQAGLTSVYRMADTVAQRRYRTAFETFVMGQINVLDINSAQTEENTAKRNYINQLYYSWLYLYNLRQITLYDFGTQSNIVYNFQPK